MGRGKKSKVLCLLAGSPLSCHCSVNVAKCSSISACAQRVLEVDGHYKCPASLLERPASGGGLCHTLSSIILNCSWTEKRTDEGRALG